MKINLAEHFGMCFGVRDALRTTHDLASSMKVTVLGQLVHNRVVREHLHSLGVRDGSLTELDSSATNDVVITAHGASDSARQSWKSAGYKVHDTTCPLVRKAHKALASLVAGGYSPVVIGEAAHVEVRGLTGDFPGAAVALTREEIRAIPFQEKFGVVSQTTQPLAKVLELVEELRLTHPDSEVVFRDTVCQPTKDRQRALEDLCRENDLVVVVGGHNSNNTHQLVQTASKLGAATRHVERSEELEADWFRGVESVGITAGTSTLDETVRQVRDRIAAIAAEMEQGPLAANTLAKLLFKA